MVFMSSILSEFRFKVLIRSSLIVLLGLFVLSQHENNILKPRKLDGIVEDKYKVTTVKTAASSSDDNAAAQHPTTKVQQDLGSPLLRINANRPSSSSSVVKSEQHRKPFLEDIDEAIAKVDLTERQAIYKKNPRKKRKNKTKKEEQTEPLQQQLQEIKEVVQQTKRQQRINQRKEREQDRQEQEQEPQPEPQPHQQRQRHKQPQHQARLGLKQQQRLINKKTQMYSKQQQVLPPLNTLIGDLNENITGNVQSLLDFAIVGFGKCGTTALINWLDEQPEIDTIPKEALHLARKRPALMVQKLYEMKMKSLTTNKGRLQGFKNPSDVRRPESMDYIRRYWPETKLIITLRHPMQWFTSLYNYLVNEMGRKPKFLQHTSLIGGPHKNTKYAHTGKGEFHAILSLLGKTNMTDDSELDLLKGFLQEDEILNWPKPLPNPVFILETSQLSDTNITRSHKFRRDLQDFLGLQHELPPVPHVRPGKDRNVDPSLKMDLCQAQNREIRIELMRISRIASQWIRQYFLTSPDVYCSSRDYLEEIFTTHWMQDPCSDNDDDDNDNDENSSGGRNDDSGGEGTDDTATSAITSVATKSILGGRKSKNKAAVVPRKTS